VRRLVLLAVPIALWACDDAPAPAMGPADVLDPTACAECHPDHVRQWSGSMHAYAGIDPVFLAMEAKGQRETNGALGDFCVQCHAPVAHRLGLVQTGADLATIDPALNGVTCAFCHQIDAVQGTHNNPLRWANDGRMRGALSNPVAAPHASQYSPLHDRNQLDSASLCGACHDIVVPGTEAHLERTYSEWQASIFNSTLPQRMNTCGHCHMPGRAGLAAQVDGVPLRPRIHDHSFPGVDLAVVDFPQREAQRALVQASLDNTLISEICVLERRGGAEVEYYLENIGAGHHLPSGSSLDRRLWVELRAYSDGAEIHQSGVVADGQPVASLTDPDLWLLRDTAVDAQGDPTHDFWKVAVVTPGTLPVVRAFAPTEPGYINPHILHRYTIATDAPLERIETRVRLRPVGLEVIDELVESGDLAPGIRDALPTFTLGGTTLTWTRDAAQLRLSPVGREALCVPAQN
jgi:hypothetical protein